jgi:hypothetical protein
VVARRAVFRAGWLARRASDGQGLQRAEATATCVGVGGCAEFLEVWDDVPRDTPADQVEALKEESRALSRRLADQAETDAAPQPPPMLRVCPTVAAAAAEPVAAAGGSTGAGPPCAKGSVCDDCVGTCVRELNTNAPLLLLLLQLQSLLQTRMHSGSSREHQHKQPISLRGRG